MRGLRVPEKRTAAADVRANPRADPAAVDREAMQRGQQLRRAFCGRRGRVAAACEDAFFYDGRGKILVEKAIDGFEIGCAVMGNEVVETGSVDEIEIESAFFDFEGKYAMKGAEIHCPARLDDELFEKARLLAKDAYRAMGCTGLARVDMFVTGGDIVLNELNTIPGFTATSRYPTMMQEAGLGFSDLIDRLIALAMERQVSAC